MTDNQLNKLATLVPHTKYTMFCQEIGISYVVASNIIAKHHDDFIKATRECLAEWKTRTGGNKVNLIAALTKSDLSGIVHDLPR